ncbi:shikimate kinase, partial [Actinomadura luteofluorescens]
MRPKAVIIGPPGSGKSTIGAALAERLGVALRDTDADVERAAGKPIGEIFIDDGEERFRELERAAVAEALTGHEGVADGRHGGRPGRDRARTHGAPGGA